MSKSSGVTSYQTPETFSEEVKSIINNFKKLVTAETAQEHHDALNFLDENFTWDAPALYSEGRDKARIILYLAKLFAKFDLDPQEVVIITGGRGVQLKIYSIFKVAPKRVWYQFWAYLLPQPWSYINIDTTLEFELNEKDKVSKVVGRVHNWPVLLKVLRYLPTFAVGQVGVWTEPVWSQFIHYLNGDPSYQQFVPRQPTTTGWGAEGYQGGYTSGQQAYGQPTY